MNKIINCSGMMSKLGVSTSSKKVIEAVSNSLNNFYVMDKLKKQIGRSISKKLQFENAIVTNSASAGIVMALAASKIKTKFNENNFFSQQSNIVIPSGHLINFNADVSLGIKLANHEIKKIGTKTKANIQDFEKNITSQTTAIFIVKSHYTSKVKIPALQTLHKLATKFNIPLIIDAAAEENFKKYSSKCDLVIGSGAKYFRGPTSGFIAGKNKWVKKVYEIEPSIGRYFKVGKEALLGLEAAIYENKTQKLKFNLEDILKDFKTNKKFKCSIVQDKVRSNIKRIKIKLIKDNAKSFIDYLEKGKTKIFTRNYEINKNIIYFDFRLVKKEEVNEIIRKVVEW